MRIIMIRSNPINPDSRVEKEAYSLIKHGHEVKVLCWDREDNYKYKYDKKDLLDSSLDLIKIGSKSSYGGGFKNILYFLKFQLRMRKWLIKNSENYDAIHACDFDTAFFSQSVAIKKKKKFIFDIFDFICGDEKNFFQKVIKKSQIRLINKSDATIICTEERMKQIAASDPKKIVVIHNTPSSNQFKINNDGSSDNKNIKIAYVGILQKGRLLPEIFDFFKKNNNIEFHVGGFGLYEGELMNLSSKYGNIKYHGRMQYEDTLKLESFCDIMLAIYDPNIENHRFAAPNKFYEALFLGKPLIMVKNTGMSNIVSENDIGVLIDYSAEGFANGVYKLIERKEDWEKISFKMKDIYSNKYNWKIMDKRLHALYKELEDENQ